MTTKQPYWEAIERAFRAGPIYSKQARFGADQPNVELICSVVWIDMSAPATLRVHARSLDMSDKYVGKLTGVGTDNVRYVINIYQDETVERSSRGMVRHEGMKHFEMQRGGQVKKISETEYEIVATGVRITVCDDQN